MLATTVAAIKAILASFDKVGGMSDAIKHG